jgi:hypothetical protein
MSPTQGPNFIRLTQAEADAITGPVEEGDHQELHQWLMTLLRHGNLEIALTDQQFGELLRAVIQGRAGGFPDQARRAFSRIFDEIWLPAV